MSFPVAPLLLDVENLCRWLEQPAEGAGGVLLSDRFLKTPPAWVPQRAPLPHVNLLLNLLIRGERQLNEELRVTQGLVEMTAVQKRQAILTLTRSIRRARKQTGRARLIIAEMRRAGGRELQQPLDLYLRMLSLQSQQFKALSQSADSAVLALQPFSYRPTHPILLDLPALPAPALKSFDFVSPLPFRPNPFARVMRWGLTVFWSGSRVFCDWLMHPVIDSRTVPLLSRVPARSPVGDREPSEPAG